MPKNPNIRKAKPSKPSSKKRFYISLSAVAVAGVAALGYVVSHRSPPPALPVEVSAVDTALVFGYTMGRADAPVKIKEFADFECPACGTYATLAEPDVRTRLIDRGIVSVTYYDFPLAQHSNSVGASLAAACAADQGKFWQMHDRLFAGQLEWNTQATHSPRSVFSGYASSLGLDKSVWQACFDAQKYVSRIQANHAYGASLGASSTPTFVIAGKLYPRAMPFDEVKAVVDTLLLKSVH